MITVLNIFVIIRAMFKLISFIFILTSSQSFADGKKNPPSYAVWSGRLKDGFPPKWERKTEKVKQWSDGEKERVLEALSDLPSDLVLQSVEGIYRMVWMPYALVAGWKPMKNELTGKYVFIPGRDYYVEEDGKISLDEDFSNNIEYFLFKVNVLQAKNPKIYEWIKKKYA